MMERTKLVLRSCLVGLVILLVPSLLRAGDCSGPDDCQGIPDNGTKAACGGGILIGICVYERSRRKKDDEKPTEDSGDATDTNALFGDPGDGSADPGPLGGSDLPKSAGTHGPPDGPLGDPNDLPKTGGPPDGPLGDPGDLPS